MSRSLLKTDVPTTAKGGQACSWNLFYRTFTGFPDSHPVIRRGRPNGCIGRVYPAIRSPCTDQAQLRAPRHRIVAVLIRRFLISACLWSAATFAVAEEVQVAVAANFLTAAQTLATTFEKDSDHEITIVPGSTGKHYAQIRNGAPFDAFLAADALRPTLLENDDLAAKGSRFTYAIGDLVLWSPIDAYVDSEGEVLDRGQFQHLGMANPDLAPYGYAAREAMESLGLWQELQDRAVRGESVGQAFQFVASGNAELGFVAMSQITKPGQEVRGSYWQVPQKLYTPIEQQAVLLTDNDAARDFLEFLRSSEARVIIRQSGYTTPASGKR